MISAERPQFAEVVKPYLGQRTDAQTLERWWRALKGCELGAVKEALTKHDTKTSKYPQPFDVLREINGGKDTAPPTSAPTKQTHWTAQDLICACHFAAMDWSRPRFGMPDPMAGRTWVERVAHAYDAGLADAAERIVGKRQDLSPTDAAREFLVGYVKQQPKGWSLPLNNSVPM